MRRIRYSVAMSLDGYIAGPNGENDWIPMDPEIDFNAIFADFDTILVTFSFLFPQPVWGGSSPPPPIRRKVTERIQFLNGSFNGI